MKENSKIKDFKNYTKTLPSSTIKVLEEIRKIVKAQVPKAEETISYQMPAFKLKKVFFYYAGFKNHIGIYPPIKKDKKLLKELAPF
ncbi:MAG TPA: DUF1801 domain-containing protein, partial [Leptospiraceae bacterium]|nr:DUF1801 domain-containing protein [Leptospiraceae bacterium]